MVCWEVTGSLASSPYMAYTVTVYSVVGVNPSSSTWLTESPTFTCTHRVGHTHRELNFCWDTFAVSVAASLAGHFDTHADVQQ